MSRQTGIANQPGVGPAPSPVTRGRAWNAPGRSPAFPGLDVTGAGRFRATTHDYAERPATAGRDIWVAAGDGAANGRDEPAESGANASDP